MVYPESGSAQLVGLLPCGRCNGMQINVLFTNAFEVPLAIGLRCRTCAYRENIQVKEIKKKLRESREPNVWLYQLMNTWNTREINGSWVMFLQGEHWPLSWCATDLQTGMHYEPMNNWHWLYEHVAQHVHAVNNRSNYVVHPLKEGSTV